MQSKKHSLFEAVTNTVVGLLTSFIIQLILYPLLGLNVSIGENLLITAIFYFASIIRGYVIRRIFNRMK